MAPRLAAAGAFVVSLAPGLGWLLAARVVQGFAGGLVYGTAPGIVTLAVSPERRGRALGTFNAAIAFGFALGPFPAGALVDAFGWRAVFVARAPLALIVFVATLML